jgi:hypothetical protein
VPHPDKIARIARRLTSNLLPIMKKRTAGRSDAGKGTMDLTLWNAAP